MTTSGCQNARKAAGLDDLHVHDQRHKVGDAAVGGSVGQETISDLFWHRTTSMTEHYSLAQLVELRGALERIKPDSGTWNRNPARLRPSTRKSPGKEKRPKRHDA